MYPEYRTFIDPYFLDALHNIVGKSVVIETVRGNLQGKLVVVKPDHLVAKSYDEGTLFFVRVQQIVHVMPN